MMMMAVLWFYIQQLLSLTTKNGQLNATSDDVDRQAVITIITDCHVWPYNCVQCAGTSSTPIYEDGLGCASRWYRTFVQSRLNLNRILSYFRSFKRAIKYIMLIRLSQFRKSKNLNSMDIFLVGAMAYHGQVGQAEFAGI